MQVGNSLTKNREDRVREKLEKAVKRLMPNMKGIVNVCQE